MSADYKRAVTRSDMQSFANLVEDSCSEPGCGMTILVEKDEKERGRKSRCTSCIMRSKMFLGEVK
jgi:hypothetical protein